MLLQSLWVEGTRLGEVQILLPIGLFAAMVLALQSGAWRLATHWMSLLLVAMLLTLASKLAFIGWGLGYAALNYTGVSGHAMMSAAVLPLTLAAMSPIRSRHGRWGAAGVGVGLALLVGLSRVVVGSHSWSEVVAGWLLGMAVTTWAVSRHGLPQARPSRRPVASWLVPAVLMVSVVAVIAWSAAFSSHRIVTRLSLALSGHAEPYTRADLLRRSERPHR
ncbi:MAG: phosphatase PAP2 family protein [Burkholderiaceae bacterium]